MISPRLRLSFAYAALFSSIGIFAPYAVLYLQSRGMGLGEVSLAFSFVPLVRIFGNPFWGWLSDHTGRHVTVFRGVAVGALLCPLVFYVGPGIPEAMLALLLGAIFHSALIPLLDALAMAALGADRAGYGEVRSVGSFGFLVACALGGWLWDGAWLTWAPLGVTVGVGVTLAVTRGLSAEGAEERSPPTLADAKELLRRPGLFPVYLVALFHQAAGTGFMLFYASHVAACGHPTWVAGAGWTLGVSAEILLLRRGRHLLSGLGTRRLILLGVGAGILRWTVTGLSTSAAPLILAQVLHCLTFAAWFLGSVTRVDELAPPALRASAHGLLYAFLSGGGPALGAAVLGTVAANQGTGTCFLVMAGVSALLLPVAAWGLRDGSRAAA